MSDFTLVIGSKTYSSWSLRPWLFLRHHNVQFKEVSVPLQQPDTAKRIREHSPSGRVPVLKHGSARAWESLAICEYVAETLKLAAAWPSDSVQRAAARSLASEMHAGFADLRRELPFDLRRVPAPQPYSAAAAADIARIRAIWRECRQASGKGGDWLFGKFGIVDAMYAPVVLRFHTYAVPVDGPERDYMNHVLNLPALREWLGASLLEPVAALPTAAAPTGPGGYPAVLEETQGKRQKAAHRPAPTPTPAPAPAAATPQAPDPHPPLAPDELPPTWKKPAAPEPPPAPAAKPQPSHKKQVVSGEGGNKVTSYIIPE